MKNIAAVNNNRATDRRSQFVDYLYNFGPLNVGRAADAGHMQQRSRATGICKNLCS